MTQYLLIFLLLFFIWLKIAVLPPGVELVLMAVLTLSFILPNNNAMIYALSAGLILDFFSLLPFGVIALSLALTIFVFSLLKKTVDLNARNLFIYFILIIFFYEICLWGLVEVFGLFMAQSPIEASMLAIVKNMTFAGVFLNVFLAFLFAYFLNTKYIYEKTLKI